MSRVGLAGQQRERDLRHQINANSAGDYKRAAKATRAATTTDRARVADGGQPAATTDRNPSRVNQIEEVQLTLQMRIQKASREEQTGLTKGVKIDNKLT